MADPTPAGAPETGTPAPPEGETPEPTTTEGETPEPTTTEGETPTDDEGRQRRLNADLATERRRRHDAERQLTELRQQSMTEQERAVTEARQAGESEATTKFQRVLVAAAVEVAAAGKFAKPALAARLLDLDAFLPEDGGTEIDRGAIDKAIDRLLADDPYLAGDTKRTPKVPGGHQGGSQPGQLTRADLKHMDPHAIEEARKAGRLKDVLSGANPT